MTDYLNMEKGYRENETRVRKPYKLMNLKRYMHTNQPLREIQKSTFTRINSVTYRLLSTIKYGKQTSLISRCLEVLCTCQQ